MLAKVPEKELAWARRMTSRYVDKSPYFLHPDEALVRNILEGLAKNKAKYGRGYCPCRPVEGGRRSNSVNICPCRSHNEDIERDGACECGIFVSREFMDTFRARGRGGPLKDHR